VDIVTLCPFRVSTLVFGKRPGAFHLSVCVKATFSLVHGGEATIADQQDTAHGDIYWDHDPEASLYAPSDFIPHKPRVDILLSGHAYAPRGVPVESITAKLSVGPFSKALRVTGERTWIKTSEGLRPTPPRPFATMPLRYELAVMQGDNKFGIEVAPGKVKAGWPLPRVMHADPRSPHGTPGFSPLPARLRAEQYRISQSDLLWVQRLRNAPEVAPTGFDFAFFNAAPHDQQLDHIELGPTIVLENLHPRLPVLETRLPARLPKAFYVDPLSRRPVDVALRCDTLWIDTSRSCVVVSWRGTTAVHSADEGALGKLVVASESLGRVTRYEDLTQVPSDLGHAEGESSKPVLPVPLSSPSLDTSTPDDDIGLPAIAELSSRASRPLGPGSSNRMPLPSASSQSRALFPSALADDSQASRSAPERSSRASQLSRAQGARGPLSWRPNVRDAPDSWRANPRGAPESSRALSRGAPDSLREPPSTRRALPSGTPERTEDSELNPARLRPTWLEALLGAGHRLTTSPPPPLNAPLRTPPPLTPSSLPPPSRVSSSLPPPSRMSPSFPPPSRVPPSIAPPSRMPPPLTPAPPTPPTGQALDAYSPPLSVRLFSAKDPLAVDDDVPSTLPPPAAPPTPHGSIRPRAEVARQTLPPPPSARRPTPPRTPPPEPSPAAFPIEQCAAIAAQMGQMISRRAQLLERHALSEERWAAIEAYWMDAIGRELRAGSSTLLQVYDAAYVTQLERDRGPIGVEEYARLSVSIERDEAPKTLAMLSIPRGAVIRIERVFLRRLTADPDFATRVRRAIEDARDPARARTQKNANMTASARVDVD